MRTSSPNGRLSGFLGGLLALPVAAMAAGEPTSTDTVTRAEWTFDRPGDFEGWRPNGHLADAVVRNGLLECRAVGGDPILELTAPFDFEASPWQYLEVRLRASRDGTGEWFWSNTTEGRFGGFSQEKSLRFQVTGDGAWHTWRVFPFWHTEGRIVRLRFDLFDGAEFALDAIRIRELAMSPATATPTFVFTNATHQWQPVGECTADATPVGLAVRRTGPGGFVLGPPVSFDAERNSFLSLHLTATRGRYASVRFATTASPGLHRFAFPLEPAAPAATYTLDLLAAPTWNGTILALGFEPGDEPDAEAVLGWFRVSERPEGPPQVKVSGFGPEEAVLRAGRPTWVQAVVANVGATSATNLNLALSLARDGQVLSPRVPVETVSRLGFDEQRTVRWRVEVDGAGPVDATLEVTSDGALPIRASRTLHFAAPLELARASYVPEPKPVRGPSEVGAYYFPGWKSAGQWQPIRDFPERRPVLGWYREGDPEVADWHIKWAVEHGLTFFAYDWYWSAGARQLEHALHDGYFQARYRHLLKFCLLWANHNAPGTHSPADCLEVTRYWIAHYFRRPEHFTVDGKPVLIIFSPQRLTEDLGSDGVRQAFEAMRVECRRAGLAGLYLLACVGEVGEARRAAEEGYDAITAYTWPGLGMSGESRFAPFATVLDGYRRQWEHLRDEAGLPLLLPVCGGWDSRPWHGLNNLVRYGRTPALFAQHLRDARRFLETNQATPAPATSPPQVQDPASAIRHPTSIIRHPASDIGPPSSALRPPSSKARPPSVLPFVLVEAWNEWGEGSYIEPHQKFGFGYLDAIRAVLTDAPDEHLDVTPADVGLGPYDVPEIAPNRTVWSFAEGDHGWAAGMNLTDVRTLQSVLQAQTTGSDPAFFSPPLHVAASAFQALELRLRLTPVAGGASEDRAQVFWRTRQLPESEATSVRFPVRVDGLWHDYRVPLGGAGGNLRWRGVITRLRLDPCSRPNVTVEIERLRLLPVSEG